MDNLSLNLLLRAKWDFSLPARGAVEHSETEGLERNPLCPSDISPYQGRNDIVRTMIKIFAPC